MRSYGRKESISNINKLPNELLEEIFLWLVRIYRGDDHQLLSRYQWRIVLEVCQLWRDVALACPHMWKYVGNYSIDRLRYLQNLAKDVPLVLCTSEDTNDGFRRVISDFQIRLGDV